MFLAHDLSLETKRLVYQSLVLGVLLYGAETWAPKQVTVKKLETFHRRCVRCIMGIGRTVQWAQHITTIQMAERFGMRESVGNLLSLARLRWLGHVSRMSDDRIPKRILFGWLPQTRPARSVKLRWHDKVKQDLKSFSISDSWYHQAQDRCLWKQLVNEGLTYLLTRSQSQPKPFHCRTCQRSFRRAQDISRHKCVTTHPQHDQR